MTDKVIKVNVTATKKQSVNISAGNVQNQITATPDSSQYYSNLSKSWAIASGLILNEDYSSKHYAKESANSASSAKNYADASQATYTNVQNVANEALTDIENARIDAVDNITTVKSESIASVEAKGNEVVSAVNEGIANIEAKSNEANALVNAGIAEINTTKANAVNAVNNTKTTILQDIEFIADGEKKEIEDLIDNGKEELKESIGDVKVLTTLEIGDIGFTQMAINESKGKRRILNGQVIIQEQYVQFTNIIKNSVALNPDLACTETEWQTEVTMNTFGLCDKFVIDDEAGTIRLPKYPNYFIGGLKGIAPVVLNGVYGNNTVAYIRDAITGELSGTSHLDTDNAVGLSVGNGFSAGVFVNEPSSNQNYRKVVYDPNRTLQADLEQEQITGTYFIQVATGAEVEDNIINEVELNNPFSLLDYKYSEYELNNISWLRSNGQYNSKAIYPAVYELLLKIYNKTITKAGVSVKLSTGSYTDTDFVLNTSTETFRLPLKVKLASGKAVVGNGLALGVTGVNGEGVLNGYLSGLGVTTAQGNQGVSVGTKINTGTDLGDGTIGITTNATKSGIETSNSGLFLYFYVGETVQNANLINAGRIEEVVSQVKANKLDKSAVKAYITQTYVSGTSWYRVYSDGWCEQGGSISAKTTVITLLKAYTSTDYSIICQKGVGGNKVPAVVTAQTATSFTIDPAYGESSKTPAWWQACGYIS